MKLAHLVNPVAVPPRSDLHVAQPVTFEAMRQARRLAQGQLDVELLAASYPEDAAWQPHDFLATQPLTRSVQDLGDFQVPRKLPLLRDLLDAGYRATDADYLVYSNVDIAPLPHFYLAVARLLASGHDALVINRRTIAKHWHAPDDLPLMCADIGATHPGFDCFVMPRRLIPELDLDDICIGVDRIGLVLLASLHVLCNSLRLLDDAHLTFHIGDDRQWKDPAQQDYFRHNDAAARRVFERLRTRHGDFDRSLPGWAGPAVRTVLGEAPPVAPRLGLAQRLKRRIRRLGGKMR